MEDLKPVSALVTNIQGYSIHDGPGIRTAVFFKGCTLRCKWCANPETLSHGVQVGFLSKLCAGCGKCLAVCPNGAILPGDRAYRIDRGKCKACATCVGACHYGALVRYGEEMDADEIFDRVKRDRIFYDASGGGVTVSGGEPLIHAEVVRRVFDLCKREGIDTCAETGGYVPKEAIDAVAPVTDRFCFDLKLIRSDRHREYTGAPNEGILENARRLVAAGADVLFRMPLVPGVNDGEENTAGTADFLKSLGLAKPRLELMPFHRMGQTKYEALDLRYAFGETASSDTAEIDRIQSVYRDLGVMCTVSR